MRRTAELALVALVAALIGAAAGAARPAAAAPPPPAQKWEYHVELCSFSDYGQMDEYKALEKELQHPWRAQFAFQQRVLNRAGAEGYELVDVATPKAAAPSEIVFYFRRPAAPQ